MSDELDGLNISSFAPLDPHIRTILHERALRLAEPPPREGVSNDLLDVAVFTLNDEIYAIESHFIAETVVIKSITPLPGVPAFIAGITALRGDIVSVLDLKNLFGMNPERPARLFMLYLQRGETRFGILADSILGVRTINHGDLQSNVATLTGIRSRYVRGITSDRIAVLDAHALLTDDRIIVRNA